MTAPRFAHATMSQRETLSKISRTANARPSTRLNHVPRLEPVAVAACPLCSQSSIRLWLTWVKRLPTTVSSASSLIHLSIDLPLVCRHFSYSRVDLYNIIAVKQLKHFADVMKAVGKNPDSLGCELCKPAVASILASQFNQHIMDKDLHDLQDTNDRFLANIQRNGTFSVVPRIPGGEISAEKLISIGQVAKKYNLYCKITGGQRIDMFGAKKQDLLDIWTELVNAGMESGHAYAKSLRTVKVSAMSPPLRASR